MTGVFSFVPTDIFDSLTVWNESLIYVRFDSCHIVINVEDSGRAWAISIIT